MRVGDFGYARVLSQADDVGVTASNVGPVRWMAPESLRLRQYSPASDVWSFGVVLYELVCHLLLHTAPAAWHSLFVTVHCGV